MSAAKHSPGPWEANGPFVNSVAVTGIADCSRADIAENWAGSDYTSHSHTEANARLIAAAPELLNELINLTARFKAAVMQAGTDEEFAELAVSSARAAIAKAEVQS
jgi:hypothetical protein